MARKILRIVQIAVVAVATLVIAPTAVNVGTGGTAPTWLAPFADWLWWVVIGSVVLVAGLEAVDRLGASSSKISRRRPNDSRNYSHALDQVGHYLQSRQRGSLSERIRLALDERPAAVRQPAHLVQRVSGQEFELSKDLSISDVFEGMAESMLILGAPGAGKTTQLLDLANELHAQARITASTGAEPPIPVLLDLTDWSRSRSERRRRFRRGDRQPRNFRSWLLVSVQDRYRIPISVGAAWLEDNRFILLLDGLDEVREADREFCVKEINALQSDANRLAVTCRSDEYDRLLPVQLAIQGAVTIRPLTRNQVVAFFGAANPHLAGVAEALRTDPDLWDLLTSPLMLTIMAFASGDRLADASSGTDLVARRRHLFDTYVIEVIARRGSDSRRVPGQTVRGLQILARISAQTDSGTSVLRLSWATADKIRRVVYDPVFRWSSLVIAGALAMTTAAVVSNATSIAAGSLVGVLSFGLVHLADLITDRPADGQHQTSRGPMWKVVWFSAIALATGGGVTIAVMLLRRVLAPLSEWSRPGIALTALGMAVVMGLVLLVATKVIEGEIIWGLVAYMGVVGALPLVLVLLFGVTRAIMAGWAVGVVAGVPLVAAFLIHPLTVDPSVGGSRPASTSERVTPLLAYVAVVTAALLLTGSSPAPWWQPLLGWVFGVAYSLALGIPIGFAVQPLLMNVFVSLAGEPAPWRRRFLRFAVDRSLLLEAEDGFRFIHLLIRDHLAQCDPVDLGAAALKRREELSQQAQTGMP